MVLYSNWRARVLFIFFFKEIRTCTGDDSRRGGARQHAEEGGRRECEALATGRHPGRVKVDASFSCFLGIVYFNAYIRTVYSIQYRARAIGKGGVARNCLIFFFLPKSHPY